MTLEEQNLRCHLIEMIEKMTVVAPDMPKIDPQVFALAAAEIAYAKGVNAGLKQASDLVAVKFNR